MANFSALKTAIQNAIRQNGNEEITGDVLQQILLSVVNTMGDGAINTIEQNLSSETLARQNGDNTLQSNINAEALARGNADTQLQNAVNAINTYLAKGYVYAGVATPTGTPVSGRVFYVATTAGRYTSFGNLQVQNGISILLVENGSWVSHQLLVVDLSLVQGSTNPVSGGAVYQAIQNEETERQASDVQLQNNINNEKNRAVGAENGLHQEIVAERDARIEGLGEERDARIEGLENERDARIEGLENERDARRQEIQGMRDDVLDLIHEYRPIVIDGDVVNAPDEEDITQKPNNLLKFKDKDYNPTIFSGLGRKYLRKNIIINEDYTSFDGFEMNPEADAMLEGQPDSIFWDRLRERFIAEKDGVYYLDWQGSGDYIPVSADKIYVNENIPYFWNGEDLAVDDDVIARYGNILTQEMMSDANTIYVIQYDFDLGGGTVTIPENCVLEFDGGSLSNGNIVGDKTCIKSEFINIFNTDVTLSGTWNVPRCYPIWFGAKGNGLDDDYVALNNCNTVGGIIDITWNGENTNYYISRALHLTTSIVGNKETISKVGDGTLENSVIIISQQSDIIVENISIDGKWDGTVESSADEHSHGINITASDNISIKNCYIKDNQGDNVYIGSPNITHVCSNINIEDCVLENPYRCCVAVVSADGVDIKNNICKHFSDYVAVIDLERNNAPTELLRNIHIEGNAFYATSNVSIVAINNRREVVEDSPQQYENVHIVGNNVFACRSFVQSAMARVNNLIISANNVRITPQETHNYSFFLTLSYSKNVIVSSNNVVIYDAKSFILDIESAENIIVTDNIFTSKAGTFENFSIFRSIEKLSITNNSFYDVLCASGSIQFISDVSNILASGNYFNNSSGFYIKNASVTGVSIIGNTTTEERILTINTIETKIDINFYDNISSASKKKIINGLRYIKYRTNFQTALSKSYLRCIYAEEPPTNGLFSSGSVCFNTDAAPLANKPVFAWINNVNGSTEESALSWEPVTVNSVRCTTANRPVNPPVGYHVFDTNLGKVIYYNGSYWVTAEGHTADSLRSGNTASRPKGASAEGGTLRVAVDIGFRYFDTDLSKPIYVKEINSHGVVTWVDATGATV